MFTGITRGTFLIMNVDRQRDRMSYMVGLTKEVSTGLEPGSSVSIDGVCQTVVEVSDRGVCFDAIQETLERSTLGGLDVGRQVAIERSARVGDEVGGHDVAGHVVGTGLVREVLSVEGAISLRIQVPIEWMACIFDKGFIAIDGSSLTLSDVAETEAGDHGLFTVHLIPETRRLTTLGDKRPGDLVNVELDARTVAIVRTVERVLENRIAMDETPRSTLA